MSLKLQDAETNEFIVPANDVIRLDFSGRFVRCFNTTGQLEISFNNGAKAFFDAGIGRKVPDDSEEFESFQLYNRSGVDITVVIGWGFGDIEDNRFVLSSQSINTKEVSANNLNDPVIEPIIDGAPAREIIAVNADRIHGFVRNLSNAYTVYVGTATAQLIPLAPNEVIDLKGTTYALYAVNNDGADVDLLVVESE